jgi:hypothetical protein
VLNGLDSRGNSDRAGSCIFWPHVGQVMIVPACSRSIAIGWAHSGLGHVTFMAYATWLAERKRARNPSAGAHFDHVVWVGTKGEHVNRAADRGCVSRLVGLFDYVSVK